MKLLIIILIILFLLYKNFFINKDNFTAITDKDKKLNIKLFYKSDDVNSYNYMSPVSSFDHLTNHIDTFMFRYIKNLLAGIFQLDHIDCASVNLKDCFINHLTKEQYITLEKYIIEHKVPHDFLEKVPKIILFFKKYENCSSTNNPQSYIIEYEGNYNLDLNGNLKDTIQNLKNFIEETINKYLLTPSNLVDYHTFDENLKLELNGSIYKKCEHCTSFIKVS